MKLPPRRVLRSIVQDAINDREEMEDPEIRDRTLAQLAGYRDFLPRLSDNAPPLSAEDRKLLVTACMHARIWRAGYAEAWAGTGDLAVIQKAKQDVARIDRTEEALGVATPFIVGGKDPAGMTSIDVLSLLAQHRAEAA